MRQTHDIAPVQRKFTCFPKDPKKTLLDLKSGRMVKLDHTEFASDPFNIDPATEIEFDIQMCKSDIFLGQCLEFVENWIKKYPNCCEYHKSTKHLIDHSVPPWDDASYRIVRAVALTVSLAESESTSSQPSVGFLNYVDYCRASFGCPSFGLHQYNVLLGHWLEHYHKSCGHISSEWRSKTLRYVKREDDDKVLVHTPSQVFERWLKSLPNIYGLKHQKRILLSRAELAIPMRKTRYNNLLGESVMVYLEPEDSYRVLLERTKFVMKSLFDEMPKVHVSSTIATRIQSTIETAVHELEMQSLTLSPTKGQRKINKLMKKTLKICKDQISSMSQASDKDQMIMPMFNTEIREAFEKKYLKVYLRNSNDNAKVQDLLSGLSAVKKANLTENSTQDITVYPSKTYTIDELQHDVEDYLATFYSTEILLSKKIVPSAFTESDYTSVLDCLVQFGRNLAGAPATYSSLGEEDFRHLFLVLLNSLFVSAIATGETFNKIGKTDICIKDLESRTIFVGECKMWKGPKAVTDALDQLLVRYVTPADTKTALIFFNNSVAGLSGVHSSLLEALKSYNGYKSHTSLSGYVQVKISHPEDVNVIIDVACIVVHVYCNHKAKK